MAVKARLILVIARPQLLKYPSLDERGEGATEKNLIHGVFVDGALVCPRKKLFR